MGETSQNYDQVVYYVAPAVLVAAILFCCFRMALVYYMQIRPRRNQQTASVQVTPRQTDLEAVSGAYPSDIREIFQLPFPPNYAETMKNDRRAMSAIEISIADQPAEVVTHPSSPPAEPIARQQRTREALRRVQSNVEAVPPEGLGPPLYSRRLSVEELDSGMLSPYSRDRLPSYEQAISQPESRRQTLEI